MPSPATKKAKSFIKLGAEPAEETKPVQKAVSAAAAAANPAKTKKKQRRPYHLSRTVLYMSHLPHGMYEAQLKNFMSQFGKVTNIKVGRSHKTGNARGFAFVEFLYPEVAQIACDTMNNYLMFEKLVKCEIVSPEKMSRAMFTVGKVNSDKPQNLPAVQARRAAKRQVNQDRSQHQETKRLRKQRKHLRSVMSMLNEVGVDGEVDIAVPKKAAPATPKLAKKLKTPQKTPVMLVDEDEAEITMKTPPNVRKVMSRGNSGAVTPASNVATPKGAKKPIPQQRELLLSAVAERLRTPGGPKGSAKKANLSLNAEKGSPQSKSTPKSTVGKLAAEKGSAKKLGTPKSAIGKLAAEKGSAKKLGTPKSAIGKLAAEKGSAKKLGTPKSAIGKLAAEKGSAKKMTPSKLAIKPKSPKSARK